MEEEQLKIKKKKRGELEIELEKKLSEQIRKQKSRAVMKERMNTVCIQHPDVVEILKLRGSIGRPAIEVDQCDLLKTIIEIAVHGSSAEEKRRADIFRVKYL